MPLISWDQHLGLLSDRGAIPPAAMPPPPAPAPPSALDVGAAALRKNNLATNAYDYLTGPKTPDAAAGYNPFRDDRETAERLAEMGPQFLDRIGQSSSPEETQLIESRILQERQAAGVLEQAGGWGLAAQVAAGVIDPATLASMALPVAAPVSLGSRGARIAAGVAAQAALDTASEAALHGIQETRTVGESVINVGAGAVLTGVLGRLATRMPKSEFEALRKGLQDELAARGPTGDSTVGAAARDFALSLEDEGIATGGRTLAKLLGGLSPTTRVLQSPVKAARSLVQRLAEVPYWLEKNVKGLPTPDNVETRIKRGIAQRRVQMVNSLDEAFRDYSRRVGADAITRKEFNEQVSAALQSNDIAAIPEVQKLARQTRKLFDEDRALLQEFKVLPEEFEVLGARSYFPRVYDTEKIIRNRAKLEKTLEDWYRDNPKPPKEVPGPDGKPVEQPPEYREPAEIRTAVQETIDHILGTVRGIADFGGLRNPSPLKSRTLNVPDELLRPWLVNDYERVMHGYLRAMAPQLEMRKAFGSISMEKQIEEVAEHGRVMAEKATTDAAKEEVRSATAKSIADIIGIRDRLLGIDGPKMNQAQWIVKAARFVRSYNYIRMLGAQTLSSFSDYGHVISRYGLAKTGRMTAKFLTNLKANKIARSDAKKLGTALEWTIDTRGQTLADIGDELAGSKLERGMQWATQKFTRLSGLATWNSSLKSITAALEQDAVLGAAKSAGKLSKVKKAKLAQMGIGEDELKRIGQQFEKYGEVQEGLNRARTELWDDKEAAQLLEDAIVKAADVMVITRSVGDVPLMMSDELFKTLMQFKSFGIAAVNRIIIPISQQLAHGDLAAANGLAAMLTLGALTYFSKEIASGREPDLTPRRVISEAMNWSGILGYLPDIYDPAAGMLNLPRLSKFSDTSPAAFALGPTYGTMTDLMLTSDALTDLDVTQSDIHKIRKLLPLQNLFYLRRIINALEGEAGEAIDAEGATHKTVGQRVTELEKPKP